jgi:hypothetical protein
MPNYINLAGSIFAFGIGIAVTVVGMSSQNLMHLGLGAATLVLGSTILAKIIDGYFEALKSRISEAGGRKQQYKK